MFLKLIKHFWSFAALSAVDGQQFKTFVLKNAVNNRQSRISMAPPTADSLQHCHDKQLRGI